MYIYKLVSLFSGIIFFLEFKFPEIKIGWDLLSTNSPFNTFGLFSKTSHFLKRFTLSTQF